MSAELYSKVGEIQAAVNSEHDYKADASGYGYGDSWDFMSEGDTGDCEDFALTKMQELLDYGVDVKNLQLMLCEVETGQHHAVLAIRTSNRGTLILDNRYNSVMLIGNVPYRFYAFQSAGTDFKSYTTRLEAVPVEYMNCHVAAFADGDAVVVEFTGQDFSQPKVIGFKQNPQNCIFNVYKIAGRFTFGNGYGNYYPAETAPSGTYIYRPDTDDWLNGAGMPGSVFLLSVEYPMTIRTIVGQTSNGSYIWVFGGSIGIGAYCLADLGINLTNWDIKRNDRYQKVVDVWSERQPFDGPARTFARGWMLGGESHIVGGSAYNRQEQDEGPQFTFEAYDDHEVHNDESDSWSGLVGYKIWAAGNFKLNGKGYVLGGSIGEDINPQWSEVKNTTREFDKDLGVWAYRAPLPQKRYAPIGFNLSSTQKGYLFGGYLGPSPVYPGDEGSDIYWATKSLFEYDVDTDDWTQKAYSLDQNSHFGQGASAGAYGYIPYTTNYGGTQFGQYEGETDIWANKATGPNGFPWGGVLTA